MRLMVLAGEFARRGHNCTFAALNGSYDLLPLNLKDGEYGGIKKIELDENEIADSSALRNKVSERGFDLGFVDAEHLSETFEESLSALTKHIAVFDDSPSRKHNAKTLIDPSFGRRPVEYKDLMPAGSSILTGARFATLRPEFISMRPKSLARRGKSKAAARATKHVVVHFGLNDPDNITGKILDALKKVDLPIKTTAVVGKQNPHIHRLEEDCKKLKYDSSVLVAHQKMAALLTDCDLVIGAAGNSAWERCCMGVPSFHISENKDQEVVNKNLAGIGAIFDLGLTDSIAPDTVAQEIIRHFNDEILLVTMSQSAALICDGNGSGRIFENLEIV